MQTERILKPAIVITIVVGFTLAMAGVLYLLIGGPPPFKTPDQNAGKPPLEAAAPLKTVAPDAGGFLLLRLNASARLSGAEESPVFEGGIAIEGFSETCPSSGKAVPLDFRKQDGDFGSEEDPAVAEVGELVCIPSIKAATPSFPQAGLVTLGFEVDAEDKMRYPEAVAAAQGRAAVFKTGQGTYQVFVGGVAFSTCVGECDALEWGVSTGISVSKVKRPLEQDTFLFSVPLDSEEQVSVTGIAEAA